MTAPSHFIVATAGHVDHGKSSLVRALTGTDPDRLPEEKARGITIELGFAQLRLPGGDDVGPELNLGIVDVPGHEDFVKNMVAGVGAVDLALLTVAADDRWMPQTEEHLQILEYLGVSRGVVALTKIDRLDPVAEADAIAAVRERLRDSPLAAAAVVPTSVISGRGLDRLRTAIRAALAGASPRADRARPRLWVDRAFTLNGIGTIVTGTLTGGTVAVGDNLDIAGKDARVRVRSIHNHGSARTSASPGMRAALNVTPLASGLDVERGDLLALSRFAAARRCYDVALSRSARPPFSPHVGEVDHAAVLRLHVGTTAVPCRIVFGDRRPLLRGERKVAQLRLAQPLSLIVGEAFVLRDARGSATIAGGIVLHVAAEPRTFRVPAHQRMLAEVMTSLRAAPTYVAARVRGQTFIREADLVGDAPFADDEIASAIATAVRGGECVCLAGVLAIARAWAALRSRGETLVSAYQRTHPTQNGMPLAAFRRALRDRSTPGFAIDALIADLAGTSCETVGAALRTRGFRPQVPAGLEEAAARMAAVLRQAGLHPPNRNELARSQADRDALEFLLKTGRAVALTAETILFAGVYAAARESVRSYLQARGSATVSELRQALETSRRVMVPLLEKLDADGVTRREGEHRRLQTRAQPAEFTA